LAFEGFIRRSKIITDKRKEPLFAFCSVLKQIVKHKAVRNFSQKTKKDLKRILEQSKTKANKLWLLEKIEMG